MGNKEKVTTLDATEASVLDETPIEEKPMTTSETSRFQELLNRTMQRRWNITAIVLATFLFIAAGITMAVHGKTVLDQEWKEILLLMLGAFIGSYGKIIDYWFSDTDKAPSIRRRISFHSWSSTVFP